MRIANIFTNLSRFIRKINNIFCLLGYLTLTFITIYIFLDVVFRYLKLPTIGSVGELSGYLVVCMCYASMSYVLQTGRHLRVDLVHRAIPRLNKPLIIATTVFGAVACLFLFYWGVNMVIHSYALSLKLTLWPIPIWVMQFWVPLGFLFYSFEATTQVIMMIKHVEVSGIADSTGGFR